MVVVVEGVLQDLLVAGAGLGEEEDMIADIHPGADIVEDIEVEAEAMPHTENSRKGQYLRRMEGSKESAGSFAPDAEVHSHLQRDKSGD